MRLRPTWVEIDVHRLEQNLRWLKSRNGAEFFCPMIKANAYGHGDLLVARVAEKVGVSALGVALIEEGIALRQGGISAPILVFSGFDAKGAAALPAFKLTPVVGRTQDLDVLPRGLDVHLEFNTGMQRLGFDAKDLPALHARAEALNITGVCTHFSHEDAADPDGQTARQLNLFNELTRGFAGERHAGKSASLLKMATPGVGTRPGIAVYGLPFDEGAEASSALEAVLSWRSELTHVHTLAAGETAGYGGQFRASTKTLVGVVPVGYADGFSRKLGGSKHAMLCRGARVPVIGRVCMDYTLIDLTALAAAGAPPAPGEPITIIGRQGADEIRATELSRAMETIVYEAVSGISARVPREVV